MALCVYVEVEVKEGGNDGNDGIMGDFILSLCSGPDISQEEQILSGHPEHQ